MRQLDIVANNVANSTTSGYKSDRMAFAEHVVQARAQHPMSQVRASGVAERKNVNKNNRLSVESSTYCFY